MAQHQPIRKSSPGTSEIPDKLYFRIGEVARLCDVPAYVLRFWESEFPQLKPNKGGTGQRLYRRRDVETALRVKTLLYDEGYTIPGARQAIKSEMKQNASQLALIDDAHSGASTQQLKKLQKDLRELLTILSRPAGERSAVHPIRPLRMHRSTPASTPEPARRPAAVKSLFETASKQRKDGDQHHTL
jgi:DNA-binding transcriptional MerR regulator